MYLSVLTPEVSQRLSVRAGGVPDGRARLVSEVKRRCAWCWAGQGSWAALATGLSGKGKGEVGRLGLGFLG